jgi:hypothetical protein
VTVISAPFRLRVQQALSAELATISRVISADTGPYAYDLSQAVFRGRMQFGDNDPATMLSIFEDPKQLNDDEAVQEQNSASKTNYDLTIMGFIPDDPENPTDPAHYLLADTKAKLYAIRDAGSGTGRHNSILGFGPKKPCIDEMYVGSGVVRPPERQISDSAWFFLPVRLCLVEDGGNAFT